MKALDIENYKHIIAASLASFIGGLLMYHLLTPSVNKDELCKFELEQVEVLNTKLASVQKKHLLEKTDLTTEIKLKARSECLKKIDNYKKLCETLRCQICNKVKK